MKNREIIDGGIEYKNLSSFEKKLVREGYWKISEPNVWNAPMIIPTAKWNAMVGTLLEHYGIYTMISEEMMRDYMREL